MDKHKFALNMPEGTGLMTYLGKGEKGLLGRSPAPGKSVYSLMVEEGRLVVPPELEKKLGLTPGACLEVTLDHGRVEILPNIHSLHRLYIEPTSRCNLVLPDLHPQHLGRADGRHGHGRLRPACRPTRRVFPTSNRSCSAASASRPPIPAFLDMVRAVKALGLRAEITTNATLLDDRLIDGLLSERLDTLWISLDGTTEESFEKVRPGAGLSRVLENLDRLAQRNGRDGHVIDIGIAFVVMKTNLGDVKHLDRLARSVGARRILVSHVLPYSEAMEKEMLCLQTLTLETFTFAPARPSSTCRASTSTTRPRRRSSACSRASRT